MKKVRIFRAWFSHGSGAILALKTQLSLSKPFSSLRFVCEAMRRERSPSEDRGRAPGPIWDNPGSYQELVFKRVLRVVCMVLQGEETILYLKDLV